MDIITTEVAETRLFGDEELELAAGEKLRIQKRGKTGPWIDVLAEMVVPTGKARMCSLHVRLIEYDA